MNRLLGVTIGLLILTTFLRAWPFRRTDPPVFHQALGAFLLVGFQGWLADVYIKMRRCPQPIISLVHGPACGGGFAFVLASDIRIAGTSARMNAAFIRLGLSSCDMGVSYFLPRLVGTSLAAELMLTGRFLKAERALSSGLVSEVVADDQLETAAQSYIDDMLLASPMGLRMTKEGLNLAVDAGGLEAAMAIENRNQLMTSAAPISPRVCAPSSRSAAPITFPIEGRQRS